MFKQILNLKDKLNYKIFKVGVGVSTFLSLFFSNLMDKVVLAAGGTSADKTFDFLKPGTAKDNGAFDKIRETVEETGYSGYRLMTVIGILGMVFSFILLGFSIATNKNNAAKKSEDKSHLKYIVIAGVLIFGSLTLVGLIKSLADQLA